MHLYEYQAKEILSKRNLQVPKGVLAESKDEAHSAFKKIGFPCVFKAQILTGGRGKAGAIIKASDERDVDVAVQLIGKKIKGLRVGSLLIEQQIDIDQEFYVAVTTDRKRGCPLVVFSRLGGIDVEEVAANEPDKIIQKAVDVAYGFQPFMAREISFTLGLQSTTARKLADIFLALYELYWEKDAELIEINPLALTSSGALICVDAKMIIDNNALFRNPDLKALRENSLETLLAEGGPRERLIYVPLEGNIGIMGTGAGMTMATIDQVVAAGGSPASFIDCGSAMRYRGPEKAIQLLKDKGVDVILISTYTGGRSQMAAEAIVKALELMPDFRIPVVVRVQGKNEEEAFEIFSKCKHPALRVGREPDEAVKIAVDLANG